MKTLRKLTIAGLIAVALSATTLTPGAAAADALLAGIITSAAGEKMGGVTVSAKAEKSTITTSVFTDESGNYYFPPLPNGKYRVWAQAPRRMGADKNGDYVYVGNSFGGTLAKINIHTKETTLVPLPDPEAHQPYQIGVDKGHNVWTNLWSTDKVAKYDPNANQWTLFDLPTRGTESRHISLLEREGQPLRVVIPYERARKVAVLTPRSEAEIQALKNQAGS